MPNRPICSIEGCGNPVKCRTWCDKHYARFRKWGSPTKGKDQTGEVARPGELMEFYTDVVLRYDGDECLIWPHSRSGDGRGQMKVNGVKKTVSRMVCEHFNGPPPSETHQAAHSCGQGHVGCVAKRHLRWATPAENYRDSIGHGTAQSSLTEDDVRRIKKLRGKIPQRLLALRFGVCKMSISNIHRGHTWSWVH